ncbi:MAG: DUF167 domain-containing protein [Paracoccaceae bacterium]
MKKGSLSHLAVPGAEIAVRVRPKASRNAVVEAAGQLRVYVTAVPEGGRANDEVARILAQALGVAKTALVLMRGHAARDPVFRLN